MQEDTLVALRDAEDLAGVLGVEAVDVPQRDHGPLVLGQSLDGGLDARPCLAREEPLLRHVARIARARRPVAGPAVVRAEEPVRIDGPFVALLVAGETRERHAASLPLAARLGGVAEDPEDPGLERRAAFESVEAGEG